MTSSTQGLLEGRRGGKERRGGGRGEEERRRGEEEEETISAGATSSQPAPSSCSTCPFHLDPGSVVGSREEGAESVSEEVLRGNWSLPLMAVTTVVYFVPTYN